jgi:hypothetical protein
MREKHGAYNRLFGRKEDRGRVTEYQLKFTTTEYLLRRGLIPQSIQSEWISVICPVHKNGNERHASLRIHSRDGYFRCMACGASGSSIVALHSLLTGQSFKKALSELRAGNA